MVVPDQGAVKVTLGLKAVGKAAVAGVNVRVVSSTPPTETGTV